MPKFVIRIIVYLLYGGLYYWLACTTMTLSEMPGFWAGVGHGYLWAARVICEFFTDIPAFAEIHATGYGWGKFVGILFAIFVGYVIEIIGQLFAARFGSRR